MEYQIRRARPEDAAGISRVIIAAACVGIATVASALFDYGAGFLYALGVSQSA